CYATGSVSGITDGYAGGLVGYNEGMLTSCYATGSVTGNSGVGGLVGENSGAITSCYATGSVTGSVLHSGGVGGLVGRNYYGTITSCYATGSVSGKSLTSSRYAGGLVGYNYGTLTACYATGSVSGITDGYAGGLVGYNEGMLTSCYATGSVTGTGSYVGGLVGENDGTITACFWDIETSSQSSSAGGTGKNTADMMKQSTFTDVNWDFTNETTNGTNDYWRMCVDGVDYPRLNWQSTDGDLACPNGVNIEDLDYFVQRWLLADCDSSNNFCGGVDIDISGMVNLTDFAIFADHWLEGVEP
ncbi:MAG: hypothetical protein NTW55_04035, partial [Planctomycetota bacterium]|nr:hypothetical protein [Planctomycetota bacterium]